MSEHPLKRWREQHRMTQEQFGAALKTPVTSVTVSRWETGTRNMGPWMALEVAEMTGIAPDVLRPDLGELVERLNKQPA